MSGAMFKTELTDFSIDMSSSMSADDIAIYLLRVHDRTILDVGKVVKLVMLSLCITRIVHYAKHPAKCLGLCVHIKVVKSHLCFKYKITL